MKPKHFLVVGAGSIGTRHLENLLALRMGEVAVVDPDEVARARAQSIGAIRGYGDLAEALRDWGPDATLVCTPPTSLARDAIQCARAGSALFIEKPVAVTLDEVTALRASLPSTTPPPFVGMVYRFDRGLRLVWTLLQDGVIGTPRTALLYGGYWLPDWHPGRDYHSLYSANASMGGGVVLDSIHTCDQLRWLLGEPARLVGMTTAVAPLELDVEAVASTLMMLECDAVAEVHVDYLQRSRIAYMRIAGEEGVLEWHHGVTVRHYVPGGGWQEHLVNNCGANTMYVEQLRSWKSVLDGAEFPPVGLDEAERNLALALAIRASAKQKCWFKRYGSRWLPDRRTMTEAAR